MQLIERLSGLKTRSWPSVDNVKDRSLSHAERYVFTQSVQVPRKHFTAKFFFINNVDYLDSTLYLVCHFDVIIVIAGFMLKYMSVG